MGEHTPRHKHGHRHGHPAHTAHPLDPVTLSKFADPLPLLPVLAPTTMHGTVPFYDVAMTQFQQKLHADLPPTTLWGYAGRFPGPTIEAPVNQPLRFRWHNNISSHRFLIPEAYDQNMHGTDMGEPQVKTVVHLHGSNTTQDSDGHPEAWFTRDFSVKGPDWANEIYEYQNQQPPAALWYHDHTMGQTRLNVYAGLAGLYLLRDRDEPDPQSTGRPTGANGAGLPFGKYEIALIIQDRMFDTDGSLLFPVRDANEVATSVDHPGPWVPEFFGNTVLVNGMIWPYLEVEPRRYRFRILNGSNARFYNLKLDSGQTVTQIGAEHGYLPRPVERGSVLLAPAERADIIIDFANMHGNVVLTNDAHEPFPDGDDNNADTAGQVMQFRVNQRLAQKDTSVIVPPNLAGAVPPMRAQALARQANVTRNMALVEFLDGSDEPIVTLQNNMFWHDSAPTRVRQGAVEVWHLANTTGDAHPIHLHQVQFQVLGRQPFDAERYRRDWIADHAPGTGPSPIAPGRYLSGPMVGPEPDETGYKDTARALPGMVTTIVVRFGQYLGEYAWHCHILDHEDNVMMLRFEVIRA